MGEEGYGFKTNISLRGAAYIFFRDKLSRHYFFSTKTIFFKAYKVLSEYLFGQFRDKKRFPSNLLLSLSTSQLYNMLVNHQYTCTSDFLFSLYIH